MDTDGLYDTSEPQLSNRIARFKQRLSDSRIEESPIDRAGQAAMNAVEDLNLCLHTAKSPEELRQVRAIAESVIAQLVITSSVALTFDEHWNR